ncbi:helix-turn-helix transcriptional regulator [Ilumatobacter nonamiensis]|uniref:helix-turn-helix transcriptional regulator n=1 Tax=Ilumatobacter nonamiensis TaxID=467093 RepID=UPI00058C23E8|nr:helix-turn-helix domain-containing protein [Ilumatobacter nonamiensis]
MSATLQTQSRAMGDPTRHAIFRHVADSAEPVGVAELTEVFGFHHNAIRQHLAKLVDAELLDESIARSGGPGRPRLRYTVHPMADGRWGVTGPYERLAGLLAEVVRSGDTPEEVGRRAAGAGGGERGEPLDALVDAMASSGFEPRLETTGDAAEIVLQRCPFMAVALDAPDTVCALHLGLARGAAERSGGVVVDELVVKDPRRAACRLRVRLAATRVSS